MGHEMADCLKVEGAHTKNRDDCTYIFSANAGAGHGDVGYLIIFVEHILLNIFYKFVEHIL